MRTAAKIFIVLGMISNCYLVFPLIVGIYALTKLDTANNKKELAPAAWLTFWLCNIIGGICMLKLDDFNSNTQRKEEKKEIDYIDYAEELKHTLSSDGTHYSDTQRKEEKKEIDYAEELEYELSSDGTYYSVVGIGTSTKTDIVIPSTYNGLLVISIGEKAFYNCSSLKSITIPDSVTSIGNHAFERCRALENIKISDSVISIGKFAFKNCYNLESITIPDNVTSIGKRAFSNCSSLTDVYYQGTQEQWDDIDIYEYENEDLIDARIHYNS